MSAFHLRTIRVISAIVGIAISTLSVVHALQPRSESARFDRLVVADPSVVVSPIPAPADAATLPESFRGRWSSFEAGSGKQLDVTIDTRSGVPMLVQGEGIPLIPGSGNSLRAAAPVTLDSLAATLRSFVTQNASLSLTADAELTLNREGSSQLTPNLWKVIFDRTVGGVPVSGDRWVFFVGHGNLIAFGATRWSPITSPTVPAISPESAQTALFEYMGLGEEDRPYVVEKPTLQIVPMAAAGTAIDAYAGSVGAGYETALAWRLSVEVAGEPGKWTALVDALTGRILSFEDTIQYAHAKGGVLPVSGNGQCPGGCEQVNFPMPFADITIGPSSSTASSMGSFSCTPGGSNATTTLAGPFVRVFDSCGSISQSVTCDNDLNLSVSAASNCSVPAGSSAGNTRAARSSFYHLNRIKEHAKVWLPSNNWLPLQLRDNVNINQNCNAFWSDAGLNGTVNFYRSGGGCGNTGEIAAVFLHEWGHGLDQNDGGGYDDPSEAYADVTAFMMTHQSCIGPGFRTTNCTGYGNACLSCTGVRDQDWDKRSTHAPQTPASWPASCPTGSGPCGREVHCEAYLSGQTVWDLAVRDLPASGLDQATAWQILDRLWFVSRSGSGGDAYTCGATVANRSCAANSWYTGFRAIDDDDGNLANGTPHAAAIFSAFNRHAIPCGTAADATNQSFTTCPALPAPIVTANPTSGQVGLSWTAVPGAASYNVLRNDQGCDWAYTLVANVAGTSYTDTGLPNVFPLHYTIQPVGSNTSCVGAVSTCTTASAGGPHASFSATTRVADTCGAGGAGNNNSVYDAGEQIDFSLTVRNDGVIGLTNVTATVTPTTVGVVMLDGIATHGSIAVGATAVSNPPHFSALLPVGLACGSAINYDVTINSTQGSWAGSFSQVVGLVTPGGGTALSENFTGGIPATWTIVNGGTQTGAAATWTTANPGSRNPAAPISSPFAIVDSDAAGLTDTQDEQLISPVMNLATATTVTLDFDEYFRWWSGDLAEKGDVDVRSSQTAGAWVTVLRNQLADSIAHRTINITAQAAGASDVQVRFHYHTARNEWWWIVDNIVVTYAVPPSCTTNPCSLSASADLEVLKSGPPTAVAGEDISYSVQVTNQGPDPAISVELTDVVPTGTTYQSVSAPAGWNCSTPSVGGTGTVSCTTPSLAASASASLTIVVRANVCAGQGTIVTNTALVSSSTPDPQGGNDSSVATTTLSDTGACDDGNACTQSDSCQGGVCVGSNPVICVASDSCHLAGVCEPSTGLCPNPIAPDSTLCNDGDQCTNTDTCQAGTCTGSNPVTCVASDACHLAGVCEPSTGECSNPAAPDGTLCNDTNQCTNTDTCQAGTCMGSNPVICVASDACHLAGACEPSSGLCTNPVAADGTSCDDASECTTEDACQAGTCVGSPVGGLPEVTALTFTSKTTRSWTASAATVTPVTYDVVRGALGEWPVGSGASESCVVSATTDTFVDIADDPAGDSGYWYLIRGRNACGVGTYGSTSSNTERITAICP